MRKTFVNKVRAVREARGMSQTELASTAGVSLPLLNWVERWHFRVSERWATRVAEALGAEPEQSFDGGRHDEAAES